VSVTDAVILFDAHATHTCQDIAYDATRTCGPSHRLPVHNDGGNYGFVDGHAKWLAESYMAGNYAKHRRNF